MRNTTQRYASKNCIFQKYLESLDVTPASNYSLWWAARSLKKPVEFKPPLRTLTGEWGRTNADKGKIFAVSCVIYKKPLVNLTRRKLHVSMVSVIEC